MFTDEQKAHFETFGTWRCASPTRQLRSRGRAFQSIMAEYQDKPEHFEIWPCVVDFALEHLQLVKIFIEDGRMLDAIESVLGPDFVWYGTALHLFGGDSRWHADQPEYDLSSIKAMIYLEPLRRDSGCLRVIPGSHRPHLHEALQPLSPADQEGMCGFGLDGLDVPAVALETDPGDLFIFHKCLWHASFGSTINRRLVSFSFAPHNTSPKHVEYFRHFFQKDQPMPSVPQPPPADLLRQQGLDRTAETIGRLTALNLHSPST